MRILPILLSTVLFLVPACGDVAGEPDAPLIDAPPPADAPVPDAPVCRAYNPPVWASAPTPEQNCGGGVVSYAISSWDFTEAPAGALTVSPTIAHFPPMTGTLTPFDCTGTFSVTSSVQGACCETYVLTGTFAEDNRWTGTFAAQFCDEATCGCATGDGATCGTRGCVDQNIQVVGTRTP